MQVASLPVNRAVQIETVCADLFGNRFALCDDLLTILLSNTNPESHLAIALCNLSRIELGESWGQRSTMTSSVGRLVEALDAERSAIAKAVGKDIYSILAHYKLSFGVTCDTVAQAAAELVNAGKDPAGPKSVDTRYVTEDLPFGIVPLIKLAKMNGVDVALHESGLTILNACYGRDFGSENDLLDSLAIHDQSTLMKRVTSGYLLR